MTALPTVITGGIGSGKSHVCRLLAQRGIAVYDCDAAAKRLLATDEALQAALRRLVGAGVYADGRLNKALLARYILASDAARQAVNDVVHPAVAADFRATGMAWMECAIYYDSGFCRRVPPGRVVCVAAPEPVRIARIMARDHISREAAKEWIDRQMPQAEVMRRADHIIYNDGARDVAAQLDSILQQTL